MPLTERTLLEVNAALGTFQNSGGFDGRGVVRLRDSRGDRSLDRRKLLTGRLSGNDSLCRATKQHSYEGSPDLILKVVGVRAERRLFA
jgi:hypothetical protein